MSHNEVHNLALLHYCRRVRMEDFMEILGALFIALIVILNASSFFGASSHQQRLYEKTAADTEFNKSAHQNS